MQTISETQKGLELLENCFKKAICGTTVCAQLKTHTTCVEHGGGGEANPPPAGKLPKQCYNVCAFHAAIHQGLS